MSRLFEVAFYAGKTVKLLGVKLAQVSSGHFTFANGSELLVDDDNPGTAQDGKPNTLTGTAKGDYLIGLAVTTSSTAEEASTSSQEAGATTPMSWTTPATRWRKARAGATTRCAVQSPYPADQCREPSPNRQLKPQRHRHHSHHSNAGDNILNGKGGTGILRGGGGNDRLETSNLNFKNLDGGAVTDTLVLKATGLMSLDLAAQGSGLHNLEVIDLKDANTLDLTAAAVLNLSSISDTLQVDGRLTSVVNAGGGWTQGADIAANGQTYHTYTQGTATLLLNTGLGGVNLTGVLPLSNLNGVNGRRR